MGDIKKRVTAIQGSPVSITPPTTGQILQWNGTEWVPTIQMVTTIQGIPVSAIAPTIGQVLQFNGTEYIPVTLPISFSPSDIDGLQLWLRADMGVTLSSGSVSNWNDQSGIGDGYRDMVQLTSINQPVFNATNGNYNNQPTLDFTASNSQSLYSVGNWSPTVSASYTVIIIGNDAGTSGSNQYGWFGTNTEPGPFMYLAESGYGYSIQNGISYEFTEIYSSGIPSFAMIEFNSSGTDTFRLNADTPVATFGLTNNDIGTNGFCIGNGGSVFLTGSIAEVLVYNSILNDGDRIALEMYIASRYGISITA